MTSILRRLFADESAATAIEYSLIVCLIATATVVAISSFGQKVTNLLGQMSSAFS